MFPAIIAALIPLLWAVFRTAGRPRRRVSPERMAAVAAVVVVCAVPGAVAALPATVTVATATSIGTLSTQISSNNVYAGLIDDNATGKANFGKLALPLVRIHAGDDGTSPPALPENTQGQWDFSSLNVLVNDETSIGQEPVMNVKFAPDWMWTCTRAQAPGDIADKTFKTFAAYMARLVSYYNKGSMTTESGTVITNPAGTKNRMTYWELWNEPDLDNETPCAPADGMSLTPSEYLTMWNAAAPAMLAVDPTLKLVGPATAGGQFGSGTGGANNDYITTLMQGATVKPAVLSFHGYGYWDNAVSDKTIFDGDGTPGINGGIDDIVAAAKDIHANYPSLPMWISEINVNSAWGNDPKGRPWGPLGAAWWGSAYSQLAPYNVSILHQYNVVESPQFGLINDQTGQPMLPYWTVKTLNTAFPTGSKLLSTSSPDSDIQVTAARRPDGKISVLVVNRRVDSANPSGGVGLPADVNVTLDTTPSSASLQQVDSSTAVASGPVTVNVTPAQTIPLHFPGYGFVLLTLGDGPAPPPPPPAPAVSLTPSTLSFGSQLVGSTSAAQSVAVKNTGTGPLTIDGIALAGANASDFARTTTCGSTLAAGASCSVAVTFSPSATGSRSASVSITDDASGSPQTLTLSGTGSTPPQPAPAVTVSPSSLSFGSQQVGTSSAPKSATVTNSGNAALTISGVAVAGTNSGDFARTTTCGSTLAAGASCTVSVTFSPSATGGRSASVTITDNASGSPHQISLSGSGAAPPPPPAPAVTVSPSSLSFGSQTGRVHKSVEVRDAYELWHLCR